MTLNSAGSRRVLITGASSGIGRALAVTLAGRGWDLVLVGRREGALQETARLAREQTPVHAATLPLDLAADGAIDDLVEQVQQMNRLDLLIHCAAGFTRSAFEAGSASEFAGLLNLNVVVPFELTRQLLPRLVEARGQVVFMNSSAGRRAVSGLSQYSATKHALKGLADALRVEVNDRGVRVLSVFCGRVATAMQQQNCLAEHRAYEPERFLQPSEVASAVVDTISLPPTVETTDIHLRPAAHGY